MMKKKIFLMFCSAAFLLGAVDIAQCAPIYNPATGHWYDLVSSGDNGSWDNAENNAIALGGHLVTINDAAEEAWLRANFVAVDGQHIRYWIGFNDAAVEGTWVWASGEPVTYTNWDSDEPNNMMPPPIGEDYAVLNWNLTTGGWNDWDHQRGLLQHRWYFRSEPNPCTGCYPFRQHRRRFCQLAAKAQDAVSKNVM